MWAQWSMADSSSFQRVVAWGGQQEFQPVARADSNKVREVSVAQSGQSVVVDKQEGAAQLLRCEAS
eukprot:7747221-Alexandrium_andersonii.AAC.1